MREFDQAWRWREERGLLRELSSVRVFHGPGEGRGLTQGLAIDRYGDRFWVTAWGEVSDELRGKLTSWLEERGTQNAVLVHRPRGAVSDVAESLLGAISEEPFQVSEGELRFWIRFSETRQPGLFLDHQPVRRWLSSRARGWTVLNAFAFTGSLSVACGAGGAQHVTTLDLGKPAVRWARENWELNGLASERAEFISDDYFERLPRWKKEGRVFDCILLDPPSFSRGKKGSFSTAKDLERLHFLALSCLAPGGFLMTSVNSSNVSRSKFDTELAAAARKAGAELQAVLPIELPETFPTPIGGREAERARYLKGWILRRTR